MAYRCNMCGKKVGSGHKVSHSNRKTNRKFKPNLFIKKLFDSATGENFYTRICTKCLKTYAKTA